MSDRKKYRTGARKKKLEDLLRDLAPPTWEEVQEWRKLWRRKANIAATEQVWRTIPPGASKAAKSARRLSDLALLTTFVPCDGVDSALSRLIVATMNGAMDCYGRAAAALDTPGRAIEYNLASKLALTAAALSKAYDSHRLCAQDLPVLVDDTVKPTGGLGTANSGGEPGDKAPSRSEERAASNDEAKHAKK